MQMPLDAATPALSDEALLVLFANGDKAAARALTIRLTPRVLAHAQRLLGNRAEAEDVAQEAMLRLWQAAPGWRAEGAKVSTWIYTVTRNLCTDRARRRGRGGGAAVPLEAVAEPPDPAPGAEARLSESARQDALQAALADLPDRQREAVVLRHLEGLSNPEIAAIMDIGVEAVESLTARGRRALKIRLAPQRAGLSLEDGDDPD